jgi:putative transposase
LHAKQTEFICKLINDSVVLNGADKMAEEKLRNISDRNEISVEKYIVMPNHIHAIITISHSGTAQGPFPTLSELVRRFKTITTKLYVDSVKIGAYPPFDNKIWQKSFYDHIILDETGYQAIWKYIHDNPLKWQEDEYYKQTYFSNHFTCRNDPCVVPLLNYK